MKFENILNPINSAAVSFDLTEKEIAYAAMLISGRKQNAAMETASLNETDLEELYNKFGLTNTKFDRNAQLINIVNLNGMITETMLYDVYKKYNAPECKNLMKLKRKAPKRSEKYKQKVNETLTSLMNMIKEKSE